MPFLTLILRKFFIALAEFARVAGGLEGFDFQAGGRSIGFCGRGQFERVDTGCPVPEVILDATHNFRFGGTVAILLQVGGWKDDHGRLADVRRTANAINRKNSML